MAYYPDLKDRFEKTYQWHPVIMACLKKFQRYMLQNGYTNSDPDATRATTIFAGLPTPQSESFDHGVQSERAAVRSGLRRGSAFPSSSLYSFAQGTDDGLSTTSEEDLVFCYEKKVEKSGRIANTAPAHDAPTSPKIKKEPSACEIRQQKLRLRRQQRAIEQSRADDSSVTSVDAVRIGRWPPQYVSPPPPARKQPKRSAKLTASEKLRAVEHSQLLDSSSDYVDLVSSSDEDSSNDSHGPPRKVAKTAHYATDLFARRGALGRNLTTGPHGGDDSHSYVAQKRPLTSPPTKPALRHLQWQSVLIAPSSKQLPIQATPVPTPSPAKLVITPSQSKQLESLQPALISQPSHSTLKPTPPNSATAHPQFQPASPAQPSDAMILPTSSELALKHPSWKTTVLNQPKVNFYFFTTEERLGALPASINQCRTCKLFFDQAAFTWGLSSNRAVELSIAAVTVAVDGLDWPLILRWRDENGFEIMMQELEEHASTRSGTVHVKVTCITKK